MGKSPYCKWCWVSWTGASKLMKLEHTLTRCIKKKNWKWLKDTKVRYEIIKLLEGKMGKTLCDMNHTNFS